MSTEIRPHHLKAIENLVSAYKGDPTFQAIIIGGSVAKGCARDDSDVDFMIVATEKEFQKRFQNNDLFINRTDLTDYPGGFVDGKIVDMAYLKKVLDDGNEPSRAAFDGAFTPYSKIDGLQEMIDSIARYPEETRAEKMRTFYSMAFIQNWLMNEADRHNNLYTKTRAASQLTLFAGRLILAYNRLLFPYHKWFYEYLSRCKEQPVGLMDQMNQVLNDPSRENSEILFHNIRSWRDWGVEDLDAYLWFMKDVEWSWMDDKATLEDW
ncbi:MAG: nucleotidyltransferase domain-containing protein [Cytophagales bacterium]|nr:nucleotidyltransferase domain-containing protein [Cytophagales bacterium]